MFRYGKTTQSAIAAMSRLAEAYDGGKTRLSSADIAETRRLPKPLVAKLLTILAQADLVNGSPGPGGGYSLARLPRDISLYDVAVLFERIDNKGMCAFGPDWCGRGAPCPLHNSLLALNAQMETFLKKTRFSVFQRGKQTSRHSSRPKKTRTY